MKGKIMHKSSISLKLSSLFLALITCAVGAGETHSEKSQQIKTAKLCFELKNSKSAGKDIFMNGKKIGEVPVSESEDFKKVAVNIPVEAISDIATINAVNIENKLIDTKRPNDKKDLFTIRNIYIEVTDSNNLAVNSNISAGPFQSFKTGFIDSGNGKKEYTYQGCPLPIIRLTLPTERMGYIKQSFFMNKTGELYSNSPKKEWQGLDKSFQSDVKRTMCLIRSQEFIFYPAEYLLDMQERNNSDILVLTYYEKDLKDQKKKIEFLRKHGIKINLMFGKIDAYSRIPGSDEYNDFFKKLAEWAPLIDVAGMDEWFLSPAVLQTEGGNITPITEKFIDAFAKYSGYSIEDAKWAFKNCNSNDKRALKSWEFCDKIQNDFAKEFVRVAKKANPKIKTWISYITKNWNKSVTCIDGAINDFDEILQCQTYWYGRASKDPLNSSLVTAPIGMGKLFRAEYPDKFLWVGIDPGYVGGTGKDTDENSWSKKLYNNTPEEAVPYLALLYATSDGVFVESSGGGIWLRQETPVVDSAYFDKFADVTSLASKIVPHIKSYKKSDIAYYYDPDADWEIIRRIYRFLAFRETNEASIGLIQQFCDVDVTKDIDKYKNVLYAGQLLPSKFDYARQNIYLMFAPEYNEKGDKIPEEQLLNKLGLKGFDAMGKNFFPNDGFKENGCKDTLQISNVDKGLFSAGKIIKDPLYPTRKASFSDAPDKCFVIGSRNKNGNVLVNSLWPSFVHQDLARTIIKKDLDYLGWTKRDCPQVNGTDKAVAVAFREIRTAVLDFGNDASFEQVKIVIFNGKDGIIRNETIKYTKGMEIELQPFNVLVAHGIK